MAFLRAAKVPRFRIALYYFLTLIKKTPTNRASDPESTTQLTAGGKNIAAFAFAKHGGEVPVQ